MVVSIDPLLCVILSGVMFFCTGFATYGCYRCFTDIDGSKVVPAGNDWGSYRDSRNRYRFRFFRRRPSTASSQATIYSVHSSEIWSGQATPKEPLTPASSQSQLMVNPTTFIYTSQIRGWTIKEEPEEENNNDRRKSAPI